MHVTRFCFCGFHDFHQSMQLSTCLTCSFLFNTKSDFARLASQSFRDELRPTRGRNNPTSGFGRLNIPYPQMRSNTWCQFFYRTNYINDLRAFSPTFYDICCIHKFHLVSSCIACASCRFRVYILPNQNLDWDVERYRFPMLAISTYPLNTCAVVCRLEGLWGENEITSCQLDKQKQSVIDKMSSNYAFELCFQID